MNWPLADRDVFLKKVETLVHSDCYRWSLVVAICFVTSTFAWSDNLTATVFHDRIQPILAEHCYACHGEGEAEGGLTLDDSPEAMLGNRQLWWAVLKNVRAGLMPPATEARLGNDELDALMTWIKTRVFAVDPGNPDPGRVTVRRLNRIEYRNTIRDLMGIDFNAEVVFPPDDTGFGFDNVGDALSLSPLLMEKFLQAARAVVQESVPTETWVPVMQEFFGKDFAGEGDSSGEAMSYDEPAAVSKVVTIDEPGTYQLLLQVRLNGSFDFDPGRCRVTCLDGDEMLYQAEYAWDERKTLEYTFVREWQPGQRRLSFRLEPLAPEGETSATEDELRANEKTTWVRFHVLSVKVVGPEGKLAHPSGYAQFFDRETPPSDAEGRREYAREILGSFASRAFRRTADQGTVERLVDVAESIYQQPGHSFEAGVAQAITAVLASPRFLFRVESPQSESSERFPLIDEFSLASRLSYFLWSTMPDQELMELAARGELRANLDAQVDRLLDDQRSEAFMRNFVGQWLRARDVEHVSLDPLVALGVAAEYEQLREAFRRRFRAREGDKPVSDELWATVRARFDELRKIRDGFDADSRQAMRQETEHLFEYVVREDRSLLELLDSDYTFLNENLAKLYGIDGVEGKEMRRVELPDGSPRGGVLTQATMLTVTSNPTRTSPVKRGLFILENLLGLPAPPAPPNVPDLEDAAKRFGDREPTLREVLAAHRESALCSSCHSRMDPLGLALENFNALGMWRDQEQEQPINASGTLATGEAFHDVRDLKQILIEHHRGDYYRCLTQKLMTYALGRGIEYYDEYVVDEMVVRLEQNQGRFRPLLHEIVRSAPFQRQRQTEVAE